jgi:hypothetical protein
MTKFAAYFLATNIAILALPGLVVAQTTPQTTKNDISPFLVVVIRGNYDYMAHRMVIDLTDKELKIFDQTGMGAMKDSLLFSRSLSPSDTLFKISKVNFDSLKYSYINPCVADKPEFSVNITKNGKSRRVWLGNYYVQEVGNFISLFNMLLPEKYRVWYDKKILEAEACTGYEKGEAIQIFDSTSGNFLRLDSTHTSVSAIDKNGRILWKTDLDSDLWNDILPFRGKYDSATKQIVRSKENIRPSVWYFRLSKETNNPGCASPDGSPSLGIILERMSFVGLDVKNGKILCSGRD